MAISCRNTIRLDHGCMKIIVDMYGHLMQGFYGEAMTQLALDVGDSNQRNRGAEMDAHAASISFKSTRLMGEAMRSLHRYTALALVLLLGVACATTNIFPI